MGAEYEAAVEIREAIADLRGELRVLTSAVVGLPSAVEILTTVFVMFYMTHPYGPLSLDNQFMENAVRMANEVIDRNRVNLADIPVCPPK